MKKNICSHLRPSLWLHLFALPLILGLVCSAVKANPPLLLSKSTSTRAIALESVTFRSEPFSPKATLPFPWPDGRTRIMLFAVNVFGNDTSVVTANAEDESHRRYVLPVEYVGQLPGLEWLSMIIVKLGDDLGEVGDVLVQITSHGVASNRVRIGIGRIGGGLTDDNGAGPTPGQPPAYTISGKINDGSAQLEGVSVTLTGNGQTRTVLTDVNGNYSFTGLPLGANFTITPSKTNYLFNPASQAIGSLCSDQVVTFTGVRLTNRLSGRVTTTDGEAIPGVVMALSQAKSAITATGPDGIYYFDNLPNGTTYTVTATKPHYNFNPATQVIYLTTDQTANFTASVGNYIISGKVTEGSTPMAGVLVKLEGSQTGATTTDLNGAYSFSVKALGNYTVTPSQSFYSFGPSSIAINSISSNQTADFTPARTDQNYVLEFDGSQQTVDYGEFWKEGVEYGQFFYEFWAMPGQKTETRYLISDGYGGAHAILFGFGYIGSDGRYTFTGNVYNGISSGIPFSSDEGPAPFEWGHFAVGWDGEYIVTYFNGVPVGKTAFKGPRRTSGVFNGGGRLLLGGSDHQNVIGRIAQVRAYEGVNPRAVQGSLTSFIPQTVFGAERLAQAPPSLLSNFFRPSPMVADLSVGFPAGTPHSGRLRGVGFGITDDRSTYPLPKYVLDPTAPSFSLTQAPQAPAVMVDTPARVPDGARVFDSFSRKNSTYAFDGSGGIGSTEGGSAGPQLWQHTGATNPFGLLNGRVVSLLSSFFDLTWVSPGDGPANLDIRVDRKPGPNGSGVNTGIAFRVVDGRNFFFAHTQGEKGEEVTVGYYENGVEIRFAFREAVPPDWTTLRVVTLANGSIKVYAEHLSQSTLIFSGTSPLFANVKNAGLWNWRVGHALDNRWDNFMIFDAQ
jgi:hypothetical protein